VQVGEYQFYRDQLWTAPELLRMTTRPINGTQKADVYSFAIILQEIMFRAEPYFIDIDPPQGMDSGLSEGVLDIVLEGSQNSAFYLSIHTHPSRMRLKDT